MKAAHHDHKSALYATATGSVLLCIFLLYIYLSSVRWISRRSWYPLIKRGEEYRAHLLYSRCTIHRTCLVFHKTICSWSPWGGLLFFLFLAVCLMKEIRNVHLITRANGTRPRQVAVLTLSSSTSNSYGLIPPDTQMKNKYASRFPNLKPMAYRNSLRLPVDPGLVLLENSWVPCSPYTSRYLPNLSEAVGSEGIWLASHWSACFKWIM